MSAVRHSVGYLADVNRWNSGGSRGGVFAVTIFFLVVALVGFDEFVNVVN